jgi:hypothetical protein
LSTLRRRSTADSTCDEIRLWIEIQTSGLADQYKEVKLAGRKETEETIKMLPEKPEPVLLAKILNQVAGLGRIHVSQPAFSFS